MVERLGSAIRCGGRSSQRSVASFVHGTGKQSQSNLSGRLRCVAKVSIGMRHRGGNQQRTSISGRRTRAVVSLLQCPTSAPSKQRFWAANFGSLNWSPAVLASAHVRVECGGTAASGSRSDDRRLPSHVL